MLRHRQNTVILLRRRIKRELSPGKDRRKVWAICFSLISPCGLTLNDTKCCRRTPRQRSLSFIQQVMGNVAVIPRAVDLLCSPESQPVCSTVVEGGWCTCTRKRQTSAAQLCFVLLAGAQSSSSLKKDQEETRGKCSFSNITVIYRMEKMRCISRAFCFGHSLHIININNKPSTWFNLAFQQKINICKIIKYIIVNIELWLGLPSALWSLPFSSGFASSP